MLSEDQQQLAIGVVARFLYKNAVKDLLLPETGFAWEDLTDEGRDMWLEDGAEFVPIIEATIDRLEEIYESRANAKFETEVERRVVLRSQTAAARLAMIKGMHKMYRASGRETCNVCLQAYPCDTIRIITGEEGE